MAAAVGGTRSSGFRVLPAGGAGSFYASAGEEAAPAAHLLRRRELSLCVPRVELRLYRRTHTSSDLVAQPPHFVYLVRCEWQGEQLPRDPACSSRRSASPRGASPGPGSPRPGSPRRCALPGADGLRGQGAGASPEFEEPWPWWDSLPGTYIVRRRWHEIVKFHEALSTELAYDSQLGCRRVKARVPVLPDRADVNAWLKGYAAIGDACCLTRTLPSDSFPEEREQSLEELRGLHWIYVRNRLMPYFAEVNAVLQELPTEILAASTSLRRFVTGGVSGRRQPSSMPVEPRFLGPIPMQLAREDIAAAVQLLRRSGSAPTVGQQQQKSSTAKGSGSKIPDSSKAATAQVLLGKSGTLTSTGNLAKTGNLTLTSNLAKTGNLTSTGKLAKTGNLTSTGNLAKAGNMTSTGNLVSTVKLS